MNPELQQMAKEAAWILALHATWMLLLAFILSKWLVNTFLKRALWRSSFVALWLLTLITFTGLYQWDLLSNNSPQNITEPTTLWAPMTLVETSSPTIINLSDSTFPLQVSSQAHLADELSPTAHLCMIWFAGSTLCLGLMILNAAAWRWRLWRRAKPASASLQSIFTQAAKQLNYSKSPTLLESSHFGSPMVMGCIRPAIVFPSDFAKRYSPTEQHLIMCHEIAHLKERDGWWQCLANLVTLTLWWHPLVWMARQSLRQTVEETADSLSTRHHQDGAELAACLVRIGREMSSIRWTGSLSIFGAGFRSQLGRRVQRLLRPHPNIHIQPSTCTMITVRLATPVLLAGILLGSASWLGLRSTESASDSLQRSMIGMMVFADAPKPATSVSSGDSHTPQDTLISATTGQASEPRLKSIIDEDTPKVPVTTGQAEKRTDLANSKIETVEKLKSIIIPEFKMAIVHGEPGFNIQTWGNLSRLRKAILAVAPSWENLTFILRGNLAQGSDNGPRISVNAIAHVKMGPLKQPDDMPPFNPGKPAPLDDDLPDSSIDSTGGMVTNFKLTNSSAYDLLLRIMHTEDNQPHHVFRSDLVVFDVDQIEGSNEILGPVLPADEIKVNRLISPLQTDNSHPSSIADLPVSNQIPDKSALYTRTYKVNPDTFLERMEAVAGSSNSVDAGTSTPNIEPTVNIQDTVHEFLSKIGIEMPDKELRAMPHQSLKACFYNDRNGTLLVRLPMPDMEILEAALAVLQEPGERNTRVSLDMHIVQLDQNGVKLLDEFGFDTPGAENLKKFEHIVDTPTLERLLLRMNLASGVEVLQSPHITALSGRQSELKAQELRRIVSHNESGKIQTEEVATGPSLSVTPRIQSGGHLEISAHFELLEFLGYEDPGPFHIVTQGDPGSFQIASQTDQKPDTNTTPGTELSSLDQYKQLLKEMDLAPKREAPRIIAKHMPSQLRLIHLSNELDTARQTKTRLESKAATNTKDTIKTQRNLASVESLIPTLQEHVDKEVAKIRQLVLAQVENHELALAQGGSPNVNNPSGSASITTSPGDPSEKTPVPLPRFNRLELNTSASLQSGQTLIMGGLKSTETIKWKNNVPVMSKIPLLGGMFRREGTSTTEQYIYILITPRILE